MFDLVYAHVLSGLVCWLVLVLVVSLTSTPHESIRIDAAAYSEKYYSVLLGRPTHHWTPTPVSQTATRECVDLGS